MSKSLTDSSTVDRENPGDEADPELAAPAEPTATTEPAQDGAPTDPVTIRGVLGGLRTRIAERPRLSLGIAVLVSLLLALGTAYLVREPAVPDGTVAQVGDTAISQDDLELRIDALKALYGLEEPTQAKKQDQFKRDAAKSAVVALLLQRAADDRGIVVTDKEVDAILAKLIRERYPDGGQRAFVEALGVMGANEEQVRDELRQQSVVAALFDDVTKGVVVTEDEARAEFDDRKDELAAPERRELLNIVVETEAEAKSVLQLLRQGRDFAQVARTYSIDSATSRAGGLLGTANRDELDDAYGTAAFEASKGGLFGPVKTDTGWHVGQVRRIFPSSPAVYGEVAAQWMQSLETEKAVKEWRSFLEDLLAKSDARYHPDYQPDDPTSLPKDVKGVDQ